jgi:hypothetical protein
MVFFDQHLALLNPSARAEHKTAFIHPALREWLGETGSSEQAFRSPDQVSGIPAIWLSGRGVPAGG